MKIKKLSKEVIHEVVEKHLSGEGYKKISVTLYPDEYGEIHYEEVEDVSYH